MVNIANTPQEIEEYDPVRHVSLNGDTITIRDRVYTKIPKHFADELVKQIKTDKVYEDILEVNGDFFMPKEKYDIYSKLSKVLSSVKIK